MTEDIKWQDTNLALFGSDTEKQVKKESAETEPAWAPVLKVSSPTLFVWRIEKFHVKPVDKKEYGEFYNGDSYIILKVTKPSDKLLYDAHFWIGEDSTADEYGTAAYKTVELDTLLDGAAVQHREVEKHESALFKSYFTTLQILNGGIETGFRHVTTNQYIPRLLNFHLTDKKHMLVNEVTLSLNSLDPSDVFIIDLGTQAVQWNGKKSAKEERYAAVQYANQLASDRFGKCKTRVIDDGDDLAEFKEYLPDAPVKQTVKYLESTKNLYKLSDESGELKFDLIASKSAPKSKLTSDDVYFLDNGQEMFVYLGENCSLVEKQNALGYAHKYLKSTQHSLIPVHVIKSGQVSAAFETALDHT